MCLDRKVYCKRSDTLISEISPSWKGAVETPSFIVRDVDSAERQKLFKNIITAYHQILYNGKNVENNKYANFHSKMQKTGFAFTLAKNQHRDGVCAFFQL